MSIAGTKISALPSLGDFPVTSQQPNPCDISPLAKISGIASPKLVVKFCYDAIGIFSYRRLHSRLSLITKPTETVLGDTPNAATRTY